MKKRLIISLAALFIFSLGIVYFFNITGNVAWDKTNGAIYVSLDGNDQNLGSIESPFRTLERARLEVRKYNKNMASDIYVYLRGGKYYLTEPFMLFPEDSGYNGHDVIYSSYPEEKAIISGGMEVDNWIQTNTPGIWKAYVGRVFSRQFYVDGGKRQRARSESRQIPNNKIIAEGYLSEEDLPYDLANTEIVINSLWRHFRCKIKERGRNILLIESPCWSYVNELKLWDELEVYFEGSYNLINKPGEWALDDGYLYYWPISGENMENVEAVMPVLDRILVGNGEKERAVHNLIFEGIEFSEATELSADEDDGFVSMQANMIIDSFSPPTNFVGKILPANINFNNSQNIVFKGNILHNLGGSAIGFSGKIEDIEIVGNKFYEISSNAIQFDNTLKIFDFGKNNRIEHNYIQNVATDYPSSVGIFVTNYFDNLSISYNTIKNLPYSGISVGWSWVPLKVNKNILIEHNFISNTVSILKDGGGIYSLGARTNQIIANNILINQKNEYGAIYLDDGSMGSIVENNIAANNYRNGLFKGCNNIIRNNYWTYKGSPGTHEDIRKMDGFTPRFNKGDSCHSSDYGSFQNNLFSRNTEVSSLEEGYAISLNSPGTSGFNPIYLDYWEKPISNISGDFDGDDIQENMLIYHESLVWVLNKQGVRNVALMGYGGSSFLFSGDFNGDGRDDVVMVSPLTQKWCFAESEGHSFIFHGCKFVGYGVDENTCIKDFDGDGNDEVIIEGYDFCAKYSGGKFSVFKCDSSNVCISKEESVEPTPYPTCTYTYSDYGSCQPTGNKFRTVESSSPDNCQGTPDLSRQCYYVPLCVDSDWEEVYTPENCSAEGIQNISWIKKGVCKDGVDKSALAEKIECDSDVPVCESFNYSEWSECGQNFRRTRNIISSSPVGCQGGGAVLGEYCLYKYKVFETNNDTDEGDGLSLLDGEGVDESEGFAEVAGSNVELRDTEELEEVLDELNLSREELQILQPKLLVEKRLFVFDVENILDNKILVLGVLIFALVFVVTVIIILMNKNKK